MVRKPDGGNPWSGLGKGWAISVELLSAIVVWGGIGHLVDRFLFGTHRVFLAIGLVVGAFTGIYLIYLTYGRGDDGSR